MTITAVYLLFINWFILISNSHLLYVISCFFPCLWLQEKDAKDIEIPNIRWNVFELMMRWIFFSSIVLGIWNFAWGRLINLVSWFCRYIYTGSVNVNLDIAQDLLRAADQYLLDGLKRLCEYAIAQVTTMLSSYVGYLDLSNIHVLRFFF